MEAARQEARRRRFVDILCGLFLHPQILIVLQHDRLWRPIRILLVLGVLGGALVGLVQYPGASEQIRDWMAWLGEVTEGMSYENGTLSWNEPDTVPFTTRHNGWKVDFRGEDFRWPGALRTGPEKRGVLFTPREILVWHTVEDAPQVVSVLDPEGKAMGVLRVTQMWPDGLTIRDGEFDEFAAELNRGLLLFLELRSVVSLVVAVFFYTFLFAGIPALFRRSVLDRSGGVRRIFCFYFYAAIPPLVVAVVYGMLNLPFLRTSEVFVLAMAAYLLLVFRMVRALFPEPPAGS